MFRGSHASDDPPGPEIEQAVGQEQESEPLATPSAFAARDLRFSSSELSGEVAPRLSTTVSDQELATFAQAYATCVTIQREYQQRTTTAHSQDGVHQVQEGMNAEIAAALHEQGFSARWFDAIARGVEQDPELRARLKRILPAFFEAQGSPVRKRNRK